MITTLIAISTGILTAIVTGLVGYVLGRSKTFYEAKQQAYEQVTPVLLKAVYELEVADKRQLNEAQAKIWLYGNRSVALKMDRVMAIIMVPSRGDRTKASQELMVEMRNDIQAVIPSRKKIAPEEVKHLYTHVK